MEHKRVTLFAGHYGSGKTNIAVNYAFYLKNLGYDVSVADLDIVNPYLYEKETITGKEFMEILEKVEQPKEEPVQEEAPEQAEESAADTVEDTASAKEEVIPWNSEE